MFEEFSIHNQFKESTEQYKNYDPHLKKIGSVKYVYQSPLLKEENLHNQGIYLVTGGRQVGKTTFLKQLILRILQERKVDPAAVLFLTSELIDSQHRLRQIIEAFFDSKFEHQYLFIDEVNYINDWDKALKYLADAGFLENMSVIITGSDSQIIRASMKRLAGRRGLSSKVDFIYYPLSFLEFVCLRDSRLEETCKIVLKTPVGETVKAYQDDHKNLNELFFEYILHGGYLPAINYYEQHSDIAIGIMNTYIQWIIGDVLKSNKTEQNLYEVLKGVIGTYNTQISWNSLSKYSSIDHHKTISDYCYLLQDLHVLNIVEAVIEHKLTGAPKKNRKIYFKDSFIHHAISYLLDPRFSVSEVKSKLMDNAFISKYIEAIVIDHCKRWAKTYYIKGNKGEVDVALILDNKIQPIEIKWTNQLRMDDLKQIQQYDNGIVLYPGREIKILGNNICIPLTKGLIHLSNKQLLV